MTRLVPRLLPCAWVLAASAQACPLGVTGVLQARELIELPAQQALFVELRQWNEDLKIFVEGAEPRWLNGPGGRNGVDYLLLEPGSGESAALCLYSTFDHSADGHYRLTSRAIAADDPALPALRMLSEAGEHWQQASVEGLPEAHRLYARVAETGLEDRGLLLNSLRYAAQTAMQTRDYDSAIRWIDRLEAEAGGDWEMRYRAAWLRGYLAVRQFRTEEGIANLQAALARLDAPGGPPPEDRRYERADILMLLLEAYVATSALEQAGQVLEEGVALAVPDFNLLGQIYNNSGYLLIKLSEQPGMEDAERERLLAQSADEHLKGLYFAEQAGDREMAQLIENNLGVLYARMGERRKSLLHFLSVLRKLGEFDHPSRRAFLFSNLSLYFESLGDLSKSETYLRQAISLSTSTSDPVAARNYCRLGTLLRLQGEIDRAIGRHIACHHLAHQADEDLLRADAELELSMDYAALQRPEVAREWIEQAVQRLPGLNNSNLALKSWTAYADILLRLGEPELAAGAIAEALDNRQDERQPGAEVDALVTALRVAKARGLRERALELGMQAVVEIEREHSELEQEVTGPSWSDRTHAAFREVIRMHLEDYLRTGDHGSLGALFNVSERSRAIGLRQMLAADLPRDPASLEARHQIDLFSGIAAMLAEEAGGAEVPPMRLMQYQHKRNLLSLARLAKVDRLAVPPVRDLHEVQAALAEDVLVLYYLVLDEDLYLLSLRHAGSELHHLGKWSAFAALRDPVLSQMSSLEGTPVGELARLSRFLLPAALPLEGVRELHIVPDTGLHTMPFAALARPAAGAQLASSYRPLMRDFRLSLLPSLSMPSPRSAYREDRTGFDITVFADPAFGRDNEAESDSLGQPVAPPDWTDTLVRLPFTAVEAERIRGRFGEGAAIFTGESANRTNLRSPTALNARILHLATHGYFNSAIEDNIGLALAPGGSESMEGSGFITLTELFGLPFRNELVVISGCETGLGREHEGEGLNSLTRGFHASGTRHVISTLWPVSDRASAVFMAAFYEALAAHEDVSAALQAAQQQLARDPVYSDPVYWSGYTLSSLDGDTAFPLPR